MVRVIGDGPAQAHLDASWLPGFENPELLIDSDYIHVQAPFGFVVHDWLTEYTPYLVWRDEGIRPATEALLKEPDLEPYIELCGRLRRRRVRIRRIFSLPGELAENDWRQYLLQVHLPFFSLMCRERLYVVREGQEPFFPIRMEDVNWCCFFSVLTGYYANGEISFREFPPAGSVSDLDAAGFAFRRLQHARRFGKLVHPAEFPD